VQVKAGIGETEGGGSDGAVFPFCGAGLKIDAKHGLGGRPVKVIANFDDAADGGGQLGFEINFLGRNFSVVAHEFHEAAAGAGGSDVNVSIGCERRGNIRAVAADRFGVTPQNLAGFCINADETFFKQLHILLRAAEFNDHA
jgi:hypothetical protein